MGCNLLATHDDYSVIAQLRDEYDVEDIALAATLRNSKPQALNPKL